MNLDGMIIVEKALCCVVEVEVFRVLLGTMEEAVTLVIIGAAMLVLAMAVMPTTVALVAIVEVLSGILGIISVLPGIVLV